MSKVKARRPARAGAAAVPSPDPDRGQISFRRLVPVLLAVLFLPAIFLLPFSGPVPGPNNSQSWEFGFSNSTAQLLIAVFLLLLFAWQLFQLRGKTTYQTSAVARTLLDEGKGKRMRMLVITMGIFQVVTCGILIAWYVILPYTHYGEFTYFIQRIEAMTLGGEPFRDFTFDYGPGMIAVPVFIYHLFRGMLPIETAYLTTLLLHYIFGFAFLAYIVSQVRSRSPALVFTVLAIPFVNLTMGLNYTPFRFTIALTSIFLLRHLYLLSHTRGLRCMAILGVAAFLLPIFNFAFSPEMGLALTIGLCAYFFWFVLGPEKRFALLVLPVFAGVAVAVAIFPHEYFSSMVSFGKGGASFPIFPTMHILAFLAAAMWVLPVLGVIAIREKSAEAPFCAGLAVLCGLFILPATGRCDSGHIYFNSLGIFVLSISAATLLATRARYIIIGIFFLIFPFLDLVTFWDHYQEPIDGALQARSYLKSIPYQRDNYTDLSPGAPLPRIHYGKLLPMAQWLQELPVEKIGIPLGADEATERYLVLTNRSIPEYHIAPYNDIFEPARLERKYQDLLGMKYILIPDSALNYLRPSDPHALEEAQGAADCKFMTGLLLFPIDLAPVHPLFYPDMEVMHHIAQEYGLVKQFPGYVLLQRKQ